MISQVDDDNSGEIEFAEFLKVIENQKDSAAKANDETDTIEAFVALGGNGDKTGEISTDKLRAVTKVLVILKTVGPTDLNVSTGFRADNRYRETHKRDRY